MLSSASIKVSSSVMGAVGKTTFYSAYCCHILINHKHWLVTYDITYGLLIHVNISL